MLTTDQIFEFIDKVSAEATLHGDKVELRHIQQVADFLARTAEDAGDRPAAERSRRIATIVGDALKRLEHA